MTELSSNPSSRPQQELLHLFHQQRSAYLSDPMPSAEKRIDLLQQLKGALLGYRERLCDALDADYHAVPGTPYSLGENDVGSGLNELFQNETINP